MFPELEERGRDETHRRCELMTLAFDLAVTAIVGHMASEIIEFASARRTSYYRSFVAAAIWNSLPSTVTAASTLRSFRRALKIYSPHLFHHLSYIIQARSQTS